MCLDHALVEIFEVRNTSWNTDRAARRASETSAAAAAASPAAASARAAAAQGERERKGKRVHVFFAAGQRWLRKKR